MRPPLHGLGRAMKLLAIDSATERLALAAVGGIEAGDIEARDLEGGASASSLALPGLRDLLARRGWAWPDVDAIAFGRGPGGFTGLRTACAVAQGLAFGLGVPVLAIDSLCLVAEDARLQHPDRLSRGRAVWVAMDARMGQIYAACYTHGERGWTTLAPPRLYDVEEFNAACDQADTSSALSGSASMAFGACLRDDFELNVTRERSRASALGRLSAQAWRDGAAVPADQALPLYLRDKVAFTSAERAAARAASNEAGG